MEFYNLLTMFGSSEQPQGIAALGIDPVAILAQSVTFLLLFWVVKRFALEKIVTTLEERRRTIDDGVRLGREMEAEKLALNTKIEAELKKARLEADKIIADSREQAAEALRLAEESTSRKIDAMLVDAQAKIKEDVDSARKSLEKDVRELIADASSIIIEEKLDSAKDMSLIERALVRARSL